MYLKVQLCGDKVGEVHVLYCVETLPSHSGRYVISARAGAPQSLSR